MDQTNLFLHSELSTRIKILLKKNIFIRDEGYIFSDFKTKNILEIESIFSRSHPRDNNKQPFYPS